MKQPDLTQILAAEAALRPYISDPKVSIAALALEVVNAYLDASPQKRKRKASPKEIVVADDTVLISLPTNENGVFFSVKQSHFDQFVVLYPAVDVAQHLRNMAAWLLNNKSNAKTIGGMPRFINGWLAKEQNRSRPNGKPSNNDNWLSGAAELAAELRAQRR